MLALSCAAALQSAARRWQLQGACCWQQLQLQLWRVPQSWPVLLLCRLLQQQEQLWLLLQLSLQLGGLFLCLLLLRRRRILQLRASVLISLLLLEEIWLGLLWVWRSLL